MKREIIIHITDWGLHLLRIIHDRQYVFTGRKRSPLRKYFSRLFKGRTSIDKFMEYLQGRGETRLGRRDLKNGATKIDGVRYYTTELFVDPHVDITITTVTEPWRPPKALPISRKLTIQRGHQLPSTSHQDATACLVSKIDSYTDKTIATPRNEMAYFLTRAQLATLLPWEDGQSMESANPHINIDLDCSFAWWGPSFQHNNFSTNVLNCTVCYDVWCREHNTTH